METAWLWNRHSGLEVRFIDNNLFNVSLLLYYHAGESGSRTGDHRPGAICLLSWTRCAAGGLQQGGLEETLFSLFIILSLSITVHGRGIQTQSGSTAADTHTHTHENF